MKPFSFLKKKKYNKVTKKNKCKVGIAFGGGGTRGFAHLGALKAFEENGIEFDEVSGTSVGSLVGTFYSYGLTASEMIEIAKKLKVKDIAKNKMFFMPSGSEGIEAIIKRTIGEAHFEDLKKPMTIVAVDIISAKEIHLTSGSLSKAIAGSCAVPGFFKPVDYEEYRLMDGGLKNTIPADVLRNNGCKVVVSVDVNHTRGYGTTSTKLLDVIAASIRILMKSNAMNGKLYSDVVIEPDLKKFKATSIDGAMEMIEVGYQETLKHIKEIKLLMGMEKKAGFFTKIFKRNRDNLLKERKEDTISIS